MTISVPVPVPAPPQNHPAHVYLASLREGSGRRNQRDALTVVLPGRPYAPLATAACPIISATRAQPLSACPSSRRR